MSNRPRPFTSMLPPSSTTRWPLQEPAARSARRPAPPRTRAADHPSSSRRTLRPGVEPPIEGDLLVRVAFTKIGPESRTQERSVGSLEHPDLRRIDAGHAARRLETAPCIFGPRTTRCTGSCRVIARMISVYTQRIGENLPGQSERLCGQASHVAACGSHSAGMRNCDMQSF